MVKVSLIAASAVVALAGCQSGFPRLTQPQPPAEEALALQCNGDAQAAQQLRDGIAAARSTEGKTELAESDQLNRIAATHACDMARMGRPDVAGSNGSNVVDRARAVGYPTCGVTQLVGQGSSAPATVAQWMVPGPNREQVLGQLSYEVGSGAARGADGRIWHSVVLGNDCS